jgi:hypothetical protein
MGADLYIKKLYEPMKKKYDPLFEKAVKKRDSAISKPEEKKYQKEVDKYYDKMHSKGYFRDSYNESNVLNKLGLDYWQDVSAFLNKKGQMSPQNADILAKMIENRNLNLRGVTEKDKKYFIEGKEELLKFLRTAKKLNTVIEASI